MATRPNPTRARQGDCRHRYVALMWAEIPRTWYVDAALCRTEAEAAGACDLMIRRAVARGVNCGMANGRVITQHDLRDIIRLGIYPSGMESLSNIPAWKRGISQLGGWLANARLGRCSTHYATWREQRGGRP